MQCTMVTSTCVHVGPGPQRAGQVPHHLGYQLGLPEVRGPHRGVSAHEGDQRGPAPLLRVLGVSLGLGAVVECDADGARADQLAAEASQPPVRPVIVENDLEENNDDNNDDDNDDDPALMRSPILQLSRAQRFLALSLGSQVMRDCSGGGTAMITRWHLHTETGDRSCY